MAIEIVDLSIKTWWFSIVMQQFTRGYPQLICIFFGETFRNSCSQQCVSNVFILDFLGLIMSRVNAFVVPLHLWMSWFIHVCKKKKTVKVSKKSSNIAPLSGNCNLCLWNHQEKCNLNPYVRDFLSLSQALPEDTHDGGWDLGQHGSRHYLMLEL